MNRESDKIDDIDTKNWYDDNHEYHNNGYPAIVYKSGTKYWLKHGELHNDFGPAIIWWNGSKEWYIDDLRYTEEEFKQYKIKKFIDGK